MPTVWHEGKLKNVTNLIVCIITLILEHNYWAGENLHPSITIS